MLKEGRGGLRVSHFQGLKKKAQNAEIYSFAVANLRVSYCYVPMKNLHRYDVAVQVLTWDLNTGATDERLCLGPAPVCTRGSNLSG